MVSAADYKYSHLEPTWDHTIMIPALRRMLRGLRPGDRLLDLGCGNGSLAATLAGLGCAIYGIDSSPSAIHHARLQGIPNSHFAVGDGTADLKRTFNGIRFEAVISVEVLEHVYAPRELCSDVYDLLSPGGVFLVTTPYHGYLKNIAIAALGQCDNHYNPLWDGGHIKFWSKKTLSGLLSEAGFTGLAFTGAGRLPFLWKSMVMRAVKPISS